MPSKPRLTKKAPREPKPIRLPEHKIGRRVFRHSTHQAVLYAVRFRGKRRAFRVANRFSDEKTDRYKATRNFLEQTIFHELFPDNSLTPIAVAQIPVQEKTPEGTIVRKRFGLVTKILQNRSAEYKKVHRDFYQSAKPGTKTDWTKTPEFQKHFQFTEELAVPLSRGIFAVTGIQVGTEKVNVANVNSAPVFFEIDFVDKKKLEGFIQNGIKNSAKKSRLLKLVAQLKKFP